MSIKHEHKFYSTDFSKTISNPIPSGGSEVVVGIQFENLQTGAVRFRFEDTMQAGDYSTDQSCNTERSVASCSGRGVAQLVLVGSCALRGRRAALPG